MGKLKFEYRKYKKSDLYTRLYYSSDAHSCRSPVVCWIAQILRNIKAEEVQSSFMFDSILQKFFEIPRFYKRLISGILDALFILVSVYGAFFIRGSYQMFFTNQLHVAVAVSTVLSIFIFGRLGLYRAVIRFIDTKVLSTIALGVSASGVLLVIVAYFFEASMPRSVPFIYTFLLLAFVGGSRLTIRGLINAQTGAGKVQVLIYGAGSSGRQLASSLQLGNEYDPVAFVDDNEDLLNTHVSGLKVHSPANLARLLEEYQVKKLLLAIPSATSSAKKRVMSQLQKYPVEVLTIPGSADLVSGRLQVDALRKVAIEDLLGREAVKPIDRLFRRCIENKNVLVTGAGGSIGSELCRQIVQQKPLSLILVEFSEYSLYSIESELCALAGEVGHHVRVVPVMCSVVDEMMMDQIIKKFSINTIYHAAAYKHVPLVEHNVAAGLHNNVWGTMNCALSAIKHKVEHFVLVSTDKAVRPTNIMGSSKRLAELVLQGLSHQEHSTRFSIVRFGNVLGSSGSVVPLFKKQISSGGPLTVTHPDITRYFMTIPEAAQLVIQAGSMGIGGEVYVLDMGEPVQIVELAKKMINLMGLTVKEPNQEHGDIEILFTGLRPGEKLYEELLIGESVEGTEHSRIMKAREVSLSWEQVVDLLGELQRAMKLNDIELLRKLLLEAPLGYKPLSNIVDSLWVQDYDKVNLGSKI